MLSSAECVIASYDLHVWAANLLNAYLWGHRTVILIQCLLWFIWNRASFAAQESLKQTILLSRPPWCATRLSVWYYSSWRDPGSFEYRLYFFKWCSVSSYIKKKSGLQYTCLITNEESKHSPLPEFTQDLFIYKRKGKVLGLLVELDTWLNL